MVNLDNYCDKDRLVLFTGTVAILNSIVLTKVLCSTVKMLFTSYMFNSVGLLLAIQGRFVTNCPNGVHYYDFFCLQSKTLSKE